jgi:sugar O-acyltransferase (sialic acid O-acetyltransferase NeuD family)
MGDRVVKQELVIVGAGGHGRVCLDIALLTGMQVRGFIDGGRPAGEDVHGVPILGGDKLVEDAEFRRNAVFFIGIGNQKIRPRLIAGLEKHDASFTTLIHPSAVVSPRSEIGEGTLVNAGVVVNTDSVVGRHCVLNTSCSVDHDCVVGDGAQVCPGATLAGGVTCGAGSYIGSGAVVLPYFKIGAGAVVGAGSSITEDVADEMTVIGRAPLSAG